MTARAHFPGRPSGPAVTPRNLRQPETRINDEGVWIPAPVSNSWLGYGFFMFVCGALAAWAFMDAIT